MERVDNLIDARAGSLGLVDLRVWSWYNTPIILFPSRFPTPSIPVYQYIYILVALKLVADVKGGRLAHLLRPHEDADRRALPDAEHLGAAHVEDDGDGERVHGQRHGLPPLALEDLLQDALLPLAVGPQPLPPVRPPELVLLGEALLDLEVREVGLDLRERGAAVAGVVGQLLAQALLDERAEGEGEGGEDGLPDEGGGLEAAGQGGGVEGREGRAGGEEGGPEGGEGPGLGFAFFC